MEIPYRAIFENGSQVNTKCSFENVLIPCYERKYHSGDCGNLSGNVVDAYQNLERLLSLLIFNNVFVTYYIIDYYLNMVVNKNKC